MKDAKILEQNEIREILADHFGIPIDNVIKSKYSYIIIDSEEKESKEK